MKITTPKSKPISKEKALEAMIEWYPGFEKRMNNTFGEGSSLQKFIDAAVLSGCEPYIPLKTSILIRSGEIATIIGSGTVTWLTPYARFLYYAKLMIDPETGSAWALAGNKKIVTDINLVYHGGGKRGSFWFERWKSDNLKSFAGNLKRELGLDLEVY